ncbi:MAG: 50S ribosomal protein L11 methyltransferase [Campylobacterota bacterium]|nr:50S ribosomal protein L11 methyltransferase [Campylobacterota bacterium]
MEKYYYELTIEPNVYYELFLDLVSSLTEDAIEELSETIIIRSEEDPENIKLGVEAFAKELSTALDTDVQCKAIIEKKQNQDWIKIYQESVQPIEIGNFYIHPSWNEPKESKMNIVIDPTLAFGSGHHETTNTCIQAIEKYVKENDKVCDVGCGSGILAIAAAKTGAVVDICDTDPVSVEDSLKNFKSNNVSPNKYWEGSANNSEETYDIVIANIVADVLTMIARDIKKISKENGIMILSGIMQQHKNKVLKKYLNSEQFELIEEIEQNDWVTLIIKKLSV